MTERFFVIIKGELSRQRAAWFRGITVTPVEPGFTLLSGEFADQAALHGILTRIRDLGLPIVALTTTQSGILTVPNASLTAPESASAEPQA